MRSLPQRTLAIWLPDWPVQHARLERPELVNQALVLSASDGRAERVVAHSFEARRLGVTWGMKTPDAESLAGTGSLMVLPHDPGSDLRALKRLAEKCERFSPSTALEDTDQPEALLLDITGLAPLWGTPSQEGEMRLAWQVERWLVEERIVGQVAIATSPGLALAVARYQDACAGSPIVVEDARATLKGLPVEALRIDEATCDRLRSLGIETVGVLLALPRAALPARFGDRLVRRLDQLLGEAPEPLDSVREEPPIAASWPFENAVRSGEALAKTTGRLLERIGEVLRRRGRGALRVLVRYELEDPEESEISVALRLFRPTTSSRELHELTELRLDQIRLPLLMFAEPNLLGEVRLSSEGQPVELRQHGARRIVRCWGPERVETGWWRGRGVRRDAWWVELDDGSRLWLGQDLRSGRWSLAGEFV